MEKKPGSKHQPSSGPVSIRQRKNAPMEMSSKTPKALPAPYLMGVRNTRRYQDPRFDERSGTFATTLFERDYGFVFDIRQKEVQTIKKQMRGEKDPDRKEELKDLYTRMQNQERSRTQRKEAEQKERERKSLQTERVASGKNPYYLKKSDKTLLGMVSQFEELKKKGKLKKYLEKKRKRNSKRDSKLLPQ